MLEWRQRAQGELDLELIWSAVLAIAVGVAVAVPAAVVARLFCPFDRLVGLPCPTCGSTRAVLALLAGDPWRALASNPGVTLFLFAWGAFALYGAVVIVGRLPRLRISSVWQRRAATAALAMVALNWIYVIAAGV